MTATHVDGRAVVATEPAVSPLSKPDNPVLFKQIVKLLLDDGSEVFGCVHCDYTRDEVAQVRPHLGAHNGSYVGSRRKPKTAPPDLMALTLAELIDRASRSDQQIDIVLKLQEDRDHWKTRAKDAEKRLNTLRNALGSS